MGAGANSSPRAPRVAAVVAAVIGAACAAAPATAGAVGPGGVLPDTTSAAVSTAESTVSQAPRPVETIAKTAAPVARAVEATVDPVVRPAAKAVVEPTAGGARAAGAITPEADTITPATADTTAPARARIARTASKHAGVSAHPRRTDRAADERAATPGKTASPAELPAAARRSALVAAADHAEGVAAPADSAPQSQPAPGLSGASASGASTSFLFGGGLALLVAALLLAGPGLLRRLTLPPAVCRPAAFVLVLERPG